MIDFIVFFLFSVLLLIAVLAVKSEVENDSYRELADMLNDLTITPARRKELKKLVKDRTTKNRLSRYGYYMIKSQYSCFKRESLKESVLKACQESEVS